MSNPTGYSPSLTGYTPNPIFQATHASGPNAGQMVVNFLNSAAGAASGSMVNYATFEKDLSLFGPSGADSKNTAVYKALEGIHLSSGGSIQALGSNIGINGGSSTGKNSPFSADTGG